jgi:D-beta-D-heptose 7-phosphate kinase/D-beta-D-heptose 1-phosphate adenosyltransferase
LGRVVTQDELILHVAERKGNPSVPRRVVFTNGCFDLLHPGHVRSLEAARALGDVLVVAVNSDASVRLQGKGPDRPLVPEAERAELLAALEAVDYVVLFDEPTPRELIARLLPDVLVKGEDWPEDRIPGAAEVEAAGGRLVRLPIVAGWSTTELLRRVRAVPASRDHGPASPPAEGFPEK